MKEESRTIRMSALDCIEHMARLSKKVGWPMTKAIRKYRAGKLDGTMLETEFNSMLFLLEGFQDHRRQPKA